MESSRIQSSELFPFSLYLTSLAMVQFLGFRPCTYLSLDLSEPQMDISAYPIPPLGVCEASQTYVLIQALIFLLKLLRFPSSVRGSSIPLVQVKNLAVILDSSRSLINLIFQLFQIYLESYHFSPPLLTYHLGPGHLHFFFFFAMMIIISSFLASLLPPGSPTQHN